MTLDDLERQNRSYIILYHSQGGATELSLCALRHDCNKNVVFYPKFSQI